MTKEQLEWIKTRITHLMANTENQEKPISDWERGWNSGYNSACEQILGILAETEEQ